MKELFRKVFLMTCIISLLVLVACSSSSEPVPNETAGETPAKQTGEKAVYIGITNPVATLNPINAKDTSSLKAASLLFDSLFDLDESLNFLPKLAESFETNDNQNFVIKLNPQAKWTDGQPLTADDVLFTLTVMANPKTISLGLQPLSIIDGLDENGRLPQGKTDISGVKIVDPHTLTVTTKSPVDPNFLKEKLGVEILFLPKHILKDVDPEKLHQHPFMQKPNVTSGAFKVVEYSKDQFIEFEANKEYYRGAPKLDKLFFKVMPSANLVAQLQTGEIDMNFPPIGTITVEDFEKVKNLSNIRTVSGKPFDHQMMHFNIKTIPDVKVRQAIAYAIDRKLLVNNLLKQEGEIVDGAYTSIHPYLNKNIELYEYNPAKAKQLLQEAGWDFNKTLDLAVPAGYKTREQAAVIIVENLRAVGINVRMNKYDIPTIIQKGSKHEFDLLMIGFPFYADPDRSMLYETGAAYNFSGYSNPEMDALFERGKKEADPKKRHMIYGQIQETLHNDLPTLSLFAEYRLKAVSKRMKVGEPKELGMLYNVHEWDVEE